MRHVTRWRLVLGALLTVMMLLSLATPALAAVADTFYGIRDNGAVDQYDPITGAVTTLIDVTPPVPDTSPSGPNGLAYDEVTHRLYYAEYTDSNGDGKSNLYFTDLDDSTLSATFAGQLPDAGNSPNRGVSDADIYNGVYYYINHGTDDLRAVTFNVDGTIANIATPIDVSGNTHAWTFDGDIAIWDGVIYGWGRCVTHARYEFFTLNVDGTGLAIRDNTLTTSVGSVALQLAFASDGTLYGHNYGTGATYEITWDATWNVTATFIRNSTFKYTDTASGSTLTETYEICGFKYRADTDAGVPGWTVYLEQQVDGEWQPVTSAVTDATGKYCFSGLVAGTYRVSEDMAADWEQVFPDGDGKHVVTLPNDTMIYGIQRSTGKIFKTDPLAPNTATLFRQIDASLLNLAFTSTSPNGIGFDQATGDVYFATYAAPPFTSRLYKFEGSVQRDLGALVGSVASGEFYNGKFYYIADTTDDMYVVSFKADGTIDTITPHMNISSGVSNWYFGDVVVDHAEGVLYGEGQNLATGKQEFFKVGLDGTGYVRINPQLSFSGLLQLAIGTNNELYAHSAATGQFFTIDRATGAVTNVSTGTNLYTDISSASVVYYNFVNAPVPGQSISGYKWYDRDTDGLSDETMPAAGIAGWKMYLYEWQLDAGSGAWGWVKVDETLTGTGGAYSFDELEPGLYKVEEGVDSASNTCWRATTDTSQQVTVADADITDINFGNVCQETSVGGFTLGYWSNKNGSATLNAYSADPEADYDSWQIFLTQFNLVEKAGTPMDPTTYTAFRSWLLKADSTNMSYMLSVQMACTQLNIEVQGADYSGLGVLDMDGNWISIADLLVEANAFLGANPVTIESGALRTEAEFYKNVFDDLNNNRRTLISEAPCVLPTW